MDDSFFVSIRRDRRPGMVRLDVVGAGDLIATARLPRPVPDSSPFTLLRWADSLAVEAPAVVQSLVSRFTNWPWEPLLLDVTDPSLRGLEWEDLTQVFPFNHQWQPGVVPYRPVIRYSPRLARMALVPVTMPVDVLVADLGGYDAPPGGVLPHSLKHFRTVHATRVDFARAAALAAATQFDVLHLRIPLAAFSPTTPPPGGIVTSPRPLVLTQGSQHPPRLVIIETDAGGLTVAKQFGHRHHDNGRPTVVVTGSGPDFDYTQFYYELTHDQLLSDAFTAASKKNRHMLLLAKGGDELLLLHPTEQALRRRVQEGRRRARDALESLKQWRTVAPTSSVAQQAEASFRAAETILAEVDATTYQYVAESQGMEPLTGAAGRLEKALAAAPSQQVVHPRVVNTWFTADGQDVPPTRALRPSGRYLLQVAVGIPTPRSVIAHPVSLPEEDLAPLYKAGGLSLRVILFSSDFGLEVEEQTLLLPQPPAGSEPVAFPVTAPASPGRARLRVAIYHANNLLQSVMITAEVTDDDREGAGAQDGVVEWALSASLRDVDRFGAKAVNLLTNEGPAGTHVLDVVGNGFHQELEMQAGELERKADEARNTLQWVCGDPEKKEQYRFEPGNRSDGADFREHLSGMAEFGYDLYTSLVISHGEAFEEKLQAALAQPTVIQAARMRSCKFVFPWALVYDLPVIPSPKNQVCPEFWATLKAKATVDGLAGHPCITNGCSHRGDTNIVCPSGFWGFRHIIEQPLSTVEGSGSTTVVAGDALDTITVEGDRPIELLNAYSKNLATGEAHRAELQALPLLQTSSDFDLLQIGHGLQRVDLDVVYFYCHGGNRRGKAWLGVGARPPEELYPSNLKAWEVRWLTRHPLVFINGCNTIGMRPDDLLTFNEILIWCKASGVLGSEITVPETLGRAFGQRFLEQFVTGHPVGDIVRRLRLELLAGFNPLGLAYTPYSLAKLHLERT